MPTSTPTVTLIYVTYNSARYIRTALDSARALDYPADQRRIVVVDNGSRDGTATLITAAYPDVTLIREVKNHGFAGGNNLAMRRYPADYFALINADVHLEPGWLQAVIGAMEADPSVGVVGSKIFFAGTGLLQHAGAGIRPNALTYHIGTGEPDRGQYDHPHDCDYVMGAAFAIRGPLAAQLGYLHEGYFMYFEETELCVAARRAGYRVRYVPDAVAHHDEKGSLSGRPTAKYLWRYHRSRYLFAMRNMLSQAERRAFCAAERTWLRESARDPRYRALMLAAKLSHAGQLVRNRWLLTLRA